LRAENRSLDCVSLAPLGAMMETDVKSSRYKTRVSRYKKNVALLRKMAKVEELEGFKSQILNLAKAYVCLVDSIERWKKEKNLHPRL
jgi:hypothetical protein